jgi:hypothetical protein
VGAGALVIAVALLLSPAAVAAPPSPIAPAPGASFMVGTPIDFTVQDSAPGLYVWVRASASAATDSAGVIGTDAFWEEMTGGPTYSARWTDSAAPGLYFWQTYRIDCGEDPDCYVAGPIRPLNVTAPTARVSIGSRCYRERTRIRVTGSGFRPGAEVDIEVGGSRAGAAIADSSGRIRGSAKAPGLNTSLPGSRRYEVAAHERSNTANRATASVRVAALAFDVSPSLFVPPGTKVRFKLSGFAARKSLYAHYRFGGSTRANVRLGRTRAPCGTLSRRAAMIPKRIARKGRWVVQFDIRRGYSPRTKPRLRGTIRLTTIG